MPWTSPRRIRIDLMTPAELAIRAAVIAVEEAGCDVRLTDAVVLLQAAKERVADFVDNVPGIRNNPYPFFGVENGKPPTDCPIVGCQIIGPHEHKIEGPAQAAKDGETVCEHMNRPFECERCRRT